MLPLLHSRNASGKSIEAKNLNNSGQAVSFDVLIAVSLFLVILATTLTIWQNQNQESENQLILQDMQAAGARTLDFLVRSQGETITGTTNNWEEETIDNTKFIGLAKRQDVIDSAKLKKFIAYAKDAANYEITKAKMLLPYDYYFRVYMNSNGTGITIEEPEGTAMEGGFSPPLDNPINPADPNSPNKKYAIIILKRSVNYAGTSSSSCPLNQGAVLEGCVAIAELKIFKEQ